MVNNKKNQEGFKLFANCIPVKGFSRSLICDLQRKNFHLIPNDLFEILKDLEGLTIDNIKENFKDKYNKEINEYFTFLTSKEYIFFTGYPELFPKLSLYWNEPSIISNAIIDINKNSQHNYKIIIEQLEQLLCKNIQIRIFSLQDYKLDFYKKLLNYFNDTKIISIDIIIPFTKNLSDKWLNKILKNHKRLNSIIIHDSPKSHGHKFKELDSQQFIYWTTDNITSEQHCGIISPHYFSINVKTFTEAQAHNTCLNRKISVDVNGEIKNCPSMTKSYGNIRDTTLQEAIEKAGFKDVWTIHKDQIAVCKDCEFRYICTDCRAYIQDPGNIYSKPAKCSYDPYTATWGVDNPTDNTLYGQ